MYIYIPSNVHRYPIVYHVYCIFMYSMFLEENLCLKVQITGKLLRLSKLRTPNFTKMDTRRMGILYPALIALFAASCLECQKRSLIKRYYRILL